MDEKIIKDIYSTYMNEHNIKHAYLLEQKSGDLNSIFRLANMVCGTKIDEESILKGSSSDIKIIFPDGNDIKKTQILELQEDFMNTSVFDKKRVYIISDASKLNKSSANTLLKFLEEPPVGVVAFLLTNNRHNIISTISSRCITIALNFKIKRENIDPIYESILNKLEEKKIKFYTNLNKEEKKMMQDKMQQKEFLEKAIILTHRKIDTENDTKKISEYTKNLRIFIEMIDLLERNINPKMVLNKMLFLMYGGSNA